MRSTVFSGVVAALLSGLVAGQGPAPPTGPTSSPQSAHYSCPDTCKLPTCHCASTLPPNGLDPKTVPQFIVVTADDAIQSYTTEVLNHFFRNRRNPNGCAPKSTYFNSLAYNNYSMVTDWYVAGNEIADHTMTHVGQPSTAEIVGNIRALNAFSGIPVSAISGFRAPFLNFTASTLTAVRDAGIKYDSSATAATPVDNDGTDAFWPYTLDYGLANNCLDTVAGLCSGLPKLEGFWEVPMYALFDERGSSGIHLMDPWLDVPASNASNVVGWLKNSFDKRYNGNRVPLGIYTHPIHLAVGYPGVPDPVERREIVPQFLDYVSAYHDVWIVTNEQLLAWMKNPVPASQLGTQPYMLCAQPDIGSAKICNGMPESERGLLVNCPFEEFPWTTCYGCPASPPTPANPVPSQVGAKRFHVPSDCATPFWDPIEGRCLCQSDNCKFQDTAVPVTNDTTGNNNSNGNNPGNGNNTGNAARTVPSVLLALGLIMAAQMI